MNRNMWKTTLREIKASLGRYLAIFAIIALGVGFFSGLKVTRQAMVDAGNRFVGEHDMFDYRLISTLGLTDDDVSYIKTLDGVEDAYGAYQADAIVNDGSNSFVARFHSLDDKINTLALKAGKMPVKSGEIIADGRFYSETSIGKTITLSTDNTDDTFDNFSRTEFTIVGLAFSPLYLNYERGNTSIGNGTISYFYYALPEDFNIEVYTDIYLTLNDKNYIYSDEYNDLIDICKPDIENELTLRAGIRYDGLYSDAEKELDDAQDKLDDADKKLADARQEIEDGKKEIADKEQELIDAKQEIADNTAKLEDADREIAENEDKLADARKTIEKNEKDLEDARKTIIEKEDELADGRRILEEKEKELEDGRLIIAQNEKDLEDARALIEQNEAMLREGRLQLEQNEAALEAKQNEISQYEALYGPAAVESAKLELAAALEQLNAVRQELEAGEAELEAGKLELAQGTVQLEQAKQELAEGEAQLVSAKLELEDGEKQLKDGKKELKDGEKKLKDARRELEDGEKELADARKELEDGRKELADAVQEIADGETKLEDARKELADGEAELTDKEIELNDAKAEVADARKQLDDFKEPDTYVLTRNENIGYACFENDTKIVDGIAVIFPVFFFLVAALVCITTMSRMIEEQRTQIGVLKALGYGEASIMAKYMLYSGSAAIFGCISGFFIGCYIFPKIIWIVYGLMYGFTEISFVFNTTLFLISLAVALLCSVGTTYISCKHDMHQVAAELIRPKSPKSGKRIFLEYITFIWRKIPFIHKVSIRNIFRYKGRFIMMLLGIGGCTGLIVTGYGIRDSITEIADEQYTRILVYDELVNFSDEMNEKDLIEFEEEFSDKIRVFMPVCQNSVDPVDTGSIRSVNMITLAKEENWTDVLLLHDKTGVQLEFPKKGEVILTHNVAKINNVSVGDTIVFRDSDFNTFTLRISGICDNYFNSYAYINVETYMEFTNNNTESAPYRSAFVCLKDNADPHESAAAFMNNDKVTSVNVNADTLEMFSKMMQSMNYIVVLVIACAAALAFIVLYNLTNINITERIREIATIKVLGFYAHETASYVFRENLALTAFGAIAGIPIGIWLHKFVMSNIKIDMVSFDVHINGISYLYAILFTFAFAAFVDFVMFFKLARINMAESLKSIE